MERVVKISKGWVAQTNQDGVWVAVVYNKGQFLFESDVYKQQDTFCVKAEEAALYHATAWRVHREQLEKETREREEDAKKLSEGNKPVSRATTRG